MTDTPIYFGQMLVATIATSDAGLHIRYDADWRSSASAFPISLSMPLTAAEWAPAVTTPWLMNLLPEGEPLRAMTQALGVSQDDVMGLIAETGRDLAGALTVGQPRPVASDETIPIASADQLERIIEELPAKPFLVGEEGVSMSLAGAQEKLPLAMIDGKLAVPVNGTPSTHILKPDNPRLAGSVPNEALSMVLARRCGLSVADVTTGRAGARSYLLVQRFDRGREGGRITRLHQEDFCQALGRSPAAKYEHNGTGRPGPSLADMFAVVRAHMTAHDITRLLDAVIFNIAIGNVDSHAKNYSILLQPRHAELAPLYDLMSGLVWANITPNHAQDIGGQRRGRHVYQRHWRRMAAAAGLSETGTVRRVGQLVSKLLAELPFAIEDVKAMPTGAQWIDTFAAAIKECAQTVMNNAQRDGNGDPDIGPE
jgi:serine/threonine-protein kinase HipA